MLRSLLLTCLLVLVSTPLLAQNTAQFNLDAVFDASNTNAELVAVAAGNVSPDDGGADNWFYILRSTSDGSVFSVVKTAEAAVPLPISIGVPEAFEPFVPGDLSDAWLDSDVILEQVEDAGGDDFRAQYDDAMATAVLVSLPEDSGLSLDLGVVELNTFWLVTYTSLESLSATAFLVDAQFGLTINLGTLASGLSATGLLSNLDALADDALLVGIRTLFPDGLGTGTALFEEHLFFTPSTNEVRRVLVAAGGLTLGEQIITDAIPSYLALPENTITSQEALTIAQSVSESIDASFVETFLSRGLLTDDLERAIWQIVFTDANGETLEEILVDALNGVVLRSGDPASSVSTASIDELPQTLTLSQNYPNPFNPETVIRYDIKDAGHAMLVIYDVLGQRIRTLVDAPQAAGSYQVRWDALDTNGNSASSGIYLYRLTVGNHSATRQMTLLR